MTQTQTSPGRPSFPLGSAIGLFFGGLWGVMGALALPGVWRSVTVTGAILLTLILLIRLRKMRAPRSKTEIFSGGTYLIVVLLEMAAFFVASVLLPKYGLQASLMQALGIIVGLHFIGLWQATKSNQMLWIAANMCLISGISLLLPRHSAYGLNLANVVTAFGNALVLWTSDAVWSRHIQREGAPV